MKFLELASKKTTTVDLHDDESSRLGELEDAHRDIDDVTLDDIMTDPILDRIPPEERHEVIGDTFELYAKAKDIVAPVIAGFADSLLKESSGKKQIIFAARDGLGAYEVAHALLQKFPGHYQTTGRDISYAYLTRKLVYASTPEELQRYLSGIGVDTTKPTLLADIGMYGSIVPSIEEIIPDMETRYIISRSHGIPGYADDSSNAERMRSLSFVPGNPAVHFLEDTFSGRTTSPTKLIERGDTLVPNFVEDLYDPRELLKRKYAIRALIDYAQSLTEPPSQSDRKAHVAALDEFLLERSNYSHLMVPHIS